MARVISFFQSPSVPAYQGEASGKNVRLASLIGLIRAECQVYSVESKLAGPHQSELVLNVASARSVSFAVAEAEMDNALAVASESAQLGSYFQRVLKQHLRNVFLGASGVIVLN